MKEEKADRKDKRNQTDRQKLQNKAQKGYKRLFINLGKKDGFFPGVLMQTLNRYVGGRQEVGHIDLLDTIAYFEVPEKDARKVMTQLTGIRFKGRQVRCNDADDTQKRDFAGRKDDRRRQVQKKPRELKGDEPDFSEEGWARRRPKRK